MVNKVNGKDVTTIGRIELTTENIPENYKEFFNFIKETLLSVPEEFAKDAEIFCTTSREPHSWVTSVMVYYPVGDEEW